MKKVEKIEFNEIIYDNWKDYLIKKFQSDETYNVEEFDVENDYIESYKITLKNKTSDTEIIFQIFKKEIPYVEIHDVVFNNPKSPKLTEDNLKNSYGFDGVNSVFNKENLVNIEDWLDIPLKYGWKEKTTFFNGKELKTNAIWRQDGKIHEIPIRQNYLDKFGCLTFPLVPFVIFWNSQKLKMYPKKTETKIIEIKPMKPE
jgi:hypothetical protein